MRYRGRRNEMPSQPCPSTELLTYLGTDHETRSTTALCRAKFRAHALHDVRKMLSYLGNLHLSCKQSRAGVEVYLVSVRCMGPGLRMIEDSSEAVSVEDS